MLSELQVENLLLIERAGLRLGPGLNVLTGETGAGKTVLAHALDLLLGGRARPAVVRPGASEAYVEGLFELAPGSPAAALVADLPGAPPARENDDGAWTIALARRVAADGRTRAYLNGRSLALADLRELGALLISFYGQHEHRKLTLAAAQLEVLDDRSGPEQVARRAACRSAHERLRDLDARREELSGVDPEREIALLEHEIAEIEGASVSAAEYTSLLERRERLSRLQTLRGAAAAGARALSEEAHDGAGASERMASAAHELESLRGIDGRLDELAERFEALLIDSQELARELRGYGEELGAEDEGSLDGVLERLESIERLIRKHGGRVDTVLEHGSWARERLVELRGGVEAVAELEAELTEQQATFAELAMALRRARRAAAPGLAVAVREQLAALAMPDAGFEVRLGPHELGPTGSDAVEFMIAPNPGVPAAPLREIASGGELSRIMLALSVARGGAGSRQAAGGDAGQSTLVFDEIDAGIGGQTARAVGDRLRALARGRQVLCITHLPQIASLGARHFSIIKDTSAKPARTSVIELSETQVLSELVRMLGAPEDDRAAQRHARALRRGT